MKQSILNLLTQDARLTAEQLAERLNTDAQTVRGCIAELEKEGVIKGYRALVSDEAFPERAVKAVIQVQIRPEREIGFDRIAKRLSRFEQVESVYLVSGGYDLQLVVYGRTLQEVALFVSGKLSSIDGVMATATHFLLKRYKEAGTLFDEEEENERLQVTP